MLFESDAKIHKFSILQKRKIESHCHPQAAMAYYILYTNCYKMLVSSFSHSHPTVDDGLCFGRAQDDESHTVVFLRLVVHDAAYWHNDELIWIGVEVVYHHAVCCFATTL